MFFLKLLLHVVLLLLYRKFKIAIVAKVICCTITESRCLYYNRPRVRELTENKVSTCTFIFKSQYLCVFPIYFRLQRKNICNIFFKTNIIYKKCSNMYGPIFIFYG